MTLTTTTTPEFSSLREKIAWEKEQRLTRYALFADIWAEVLDAQRRATNDTPEVFAFNCGFAQIVMSPATSTFCRWLVKNGHASSRYNGGIQVFIHADGGQDVDRKVVVASAMLEVLKRRLGDSGYAPAHMFISSRLD